MRKDALGFLAWGILAGHAVLAEVTLKLTERRAGLPVFGGFEIAAEVRASGEDVMWVEVYLDDRRVGSLVRPSWRMTVRI